MWPVLKAEQIPMINKLLFKLQRGIINNCGKLNKQAACLAALNHEPTPTPTE